MMRTDKDFMGRDNKEEPPPLLSTWKNLYLLVACNLVMLICLFYAFTKYFD